MAGSSLIARRSRRILALLALGAVAMLALSSCAGAKTTPEQTAATLKPERARGKVKLRRVGTFSAPTYLTGAPGYPKLEFVTEQGGRVMVLRGSHKRRHPFLNVSSLISSGGEEGLLSIAFPPDYRQSGLFYVCYTKPNDDLEVDEFHRRSAARAAAG